MKELMRYGFTLSLICTIAGGLLSGVNSLTRPKILAQAEAEEKNALIELFSEAGNFNPVRSEAEIIYYKVYSKDNKLIGIVFKTKVRGYSADIETMAGMDLKGRISQIKILSQNETPGLGNRITEDAFISKFKNINADELAKIEAITGATISSGAVIDSVSKKAEEIKALLKNER